jgi:hypothetical protein
VDVVHPHARNALEIVPRDCGIRPRTRGADGLLVALLRERGSAAHADD